jgi:hypothetical protein
MSFLDRKALLFLQGCREDVATEQDRESTGGDIPTLENGVK